MLYITFRVHPEHFSCGLDYVLPEQFLILNKWWLNNSPENNHDAPILSGAFVLLLWPAVVFSGQIALMAVLRQEGFLTHFISVTLSFLSTFESDTQKAPLKSTTSYKFVKPGNLKTL